MSRFSVVPGRFTASIEGDFVVFIIGMRVNKLWKLHTWIPVGRAMGPMISELMSHPEKGMLGVRTMWAGRTITLVQYWRSFEHLEHFARDKDDPHLQAWRNFNTKVGTSGDVGVYHETYRIPAGAYECIYSNMPVMGLGAATTAEHMPVARRGEASRERMAAATAG